MDSHAEYLALLRSKVEQLGKLANDVCWSDNQQRSIADLRKDIGRMFDHLNDKPKCQCKQHNPICKDEAKHGS